MRLFIVLEQFVRVVDAGEGEPEDDPQHKTQDQEPCQADGPGRPSIEDARTRRIRQGNRCRRGADRTGWELITGGQGWFDRTALFHSVVGHLVPNHGQKAWGAAGYNTRATISASKNTQDRSYARFC